MPVCKICGATEDVFTYKIHTYSDFTSEAYYVYDYAGTGDPVPSELVESHWHHDTLCTRCAQHTWGCTTVDSEEYPDGYVYDPHPVLFYWCIGCNAYHRFINADMWYDGQLPDIPARPFTPIFTSGRGNITCNLPPYTTSAQVPYTTQAMACSDSIYNGYASDHIGQDVYTCSFCGRSVTRDHTVVEQGQPICYDCIDCTAVCEECGSRIHLSDIYRDEETDDILCESCYDERDSNNDENDYERYIHDYNYKPCPEFYPDTANDDLYRTIVDKELPDAFFGIELEIDQRGNRNVPETLAEFFCCSVPGFNDRFYIKHDGSLNYGMEIVSHPHTYAAHFNLDLWKTIMSTAISKGYTSHDATTCGLHFHISKNSLGKTRNEQDDTAYKMVLLTEVLWSDFVKFSRRSSSSYCHKHDVWVKTDNFDKFKDKARSNMGRYNAINLTNTNTIEFRLIRGTINYNTFIASLQFVYMLRLIAMTLSATSISHSKFDVFIETALRLGFTEFLEYCKTKKFSHKILIPVSEQNNMDDQSN